MRMLTNMTYTGKKKSLITYILPEQGKIGLTCNTRGFNEAATTKEFEEGTSQKIC